MRAAIFKALFRRVARVAGGPARLQVILILAAVLGLATADAGTLSAVGGQLKRAFDIKNTQIGLLASAVSFVGAVAIIPMGVLADRIARRRLLMITIPVWAAAMIASGLVTSLLCMFPPEPQNDREDVESVPHQLRTASIFAVSATQ